ncbi:MAG: 1-deoxy-D-xylulose-5-phosphate synthase [Planctomycetes bacterium]|nr:1-deoxy-D-xylulose-5-phosphate synthase [Planctomycetota bacterium]
MGRILPTINCPGDIKALSWEDLESLAAEIREEITAVVSRNGGHLSSNLGVVELTLALHRCYDFSKDRLVLDVGHQDYTHKILTGRREAFATIRTAGGLSGFPNPAESPWDTFIEGHAGAALSQALGLVLGRELKGVPGRVVAFVGDGSLTTGMALEALNNAGHMGKRFLVVLNDNNMSISRSVGGISNYLNSIRVGPTYNELKQEVRLLLHRIPKLGPTMEAAIADIRDGVRRAVMPGRMFEEMGFAYFGPFDGHNIKLLCETFTEIEQLPLDKPVMVHVLTEKGRGFAPAEKDPTTYHSAAPFTRENGKVKAASEGPQIPTYTNAFADALVDVGRRNEDVVVITAAMPDGTGTIAFGREFPERFFDVGICEQHAVGLAAGLATAGLVPVVAVYSTFLQRAYDQLFHEITLQGLGCVFCLDRAGLVGADGPTHHGVFDIGYTRQFPGMVVMAPADAAELKLMLEFAVGLGQPVAIRFPRATIVDWVARVEPVAIELGRATQLVSGGDATILAYGATAAAALDAVEILKAEGIDAALVNARFAKPADEEMILEAARRGPIVTVEEHAAVGGFGSAVLEVLAQGGVAARVVRLAVPDRFVEHGVRARLLASISLDAAGIADAVRDVVLGTRGLPKAHRAAGEAVK